MTGSHDGGSGWAGHGPVECTEREILHGEKLVNTSHQLVQYFNTFYCILYFLKCLLYGFVQISGVSGVTESMSSLGELKVGCL